jgi:sec-independent protein translocase protein TatA
MFQGLTGVHLLIILGIVVLLFGATKLPALAKGVGQSINIFKKEMDTKDTTSDPTNPAPTTTQPTAAPTQTYTAPQEPVLNPGPSVQPNSDHKA